MLYKSLLPKFNIIETENLINTTYYDSENNIYNILRPATVCVSYLFLFNMHKMSEDNLINLRDKITQSLITTTIYTYFIEYLIYSYHPKV
jgi:hypothetical protein